MSIEQDDSLKFWRAIFIKGYNHPESQLSEYSEHESDIDKKIVTLLRKLKPLTTIILEILFGKRQTKVNYKHQNKYNSIINIDEYTKLFIATYEEIHEKNQDKNQKAKDPQFLDKSAKQSIQEAVRKIKEELHKIIATDDKEGLVFKTVHDIGYVLLIGKKKDTEIEWRAIKRKISALRKEGKPLSKVKKYKKNRKRQRTTEIRKKMALQSLNII